MHYTKKYEEVGWYIRKVSHYTRLLFAIVHWDIIRLDRCGQRLFFCLSDKGTKFSACHDD